MRSISPQLNREGPSDYSPTPLRSPERLGPTNKMKLPNVCHMLLTAGVCGVTVKGISLPTTLLFSTPTTTIGAPHNASGHSSVDDSNFFPQNNYGGWVNPENLTPMPQCIAQQDQSNWLTTMSKCTSKRCTSHFGIICRHHQWLTQLSCLSTGFSSDVIKGYLPFCSRSVLAKAQLYLWIRNTTGRTWLVDVGDANGLENLSPASLAKGYAAVDVTYNAPTCLTSSVSALSMEPFQHAMASCGFTSTTQHTGNAARPWEYRGSIVALDFETVGYNLVRRSIPYGNYFDKDCFCGSFTIDAKNEPCSGLQKIDLTRERLWINATCGPTSLPANWTEELKTTKFAYIPIEDWRWPMCVTDMPKQVTERPGRCTTDACEPDSSGYCKVKRAVDRACFCRDTNYESCGEPCQDFETRIGYVKWLHDLCGNVKDWHGLPDNWHQLVTFTSLEMTPWQWTIKPSNNSNIAMETCVSNEWKIGSFALVNTITFLAAFLSRRRDTHGIIRGFLWHPQSQHWFSTGILIAALQLLANLINAFRVQQTNGYEDVPVIQLMLLWCSMPRLAWLPTLLIGVQPFKTKHFSAVASYLFAEVILQMLSSYYMIMTVNYGQEHNFYLGGMGSAERGSSASMMYAGALLWVIIMSMAFIQLMWTTRWMNRPTGSDSVNLPKRQRSKRTTSNIAEELMALWTECYIWFREVLTQCWTDKSRPLEETSLTSSEGESHRVYGTFPVQGQNDGVSHKAFVELHAITAINMLLLWIAQWLFWGGFFGLSSEE